MKKEHKEEDGEEIWRKKKWWKRDNEKKTMKKKYEGRRNDKKELVTIKKETMKREHKEGTEIWRKEKEKFCSYTLLNFFYSCLNAMAEKK